MRPMQYGATFARFWWLILLTTVIGVGIGATQDGSGTVEYSATARVSVLPTKAKAENINDRYLVSLRAVQAGAVAQTRKDLYLALIDDPDLLSRLSDNGITLSASELNDKVKVAALGTAVSMSVTATDEDAARAEELAGQVAEAYAGVITRVEKERNGETLLRGVVIGETSAAVAGVTPPRWRNPLIGAVAGVALGLAVSILLARVDPKVRDRRTLEELLGAPVLATVPAARPAGRRLRSNSDAPDPVEELRTNIYFMRTDTGRALRVALASVPPLEGTADLARSLADSLADTGARVLVVDADVLAHDVQTFEEREAPVPSGHTGARGVVDILPAGQGGTLSDDLLHGAAFANSLDEASRDYDFLLVQTAPVVAGSGALAVAARSDITVLATGRRGTRRRQLVAARTGLERVGARLAGSVIIS